MAPTKIFSPHVERTRSSLALQKPTFIFKREALTSRLRPASCPNGKSLSQSLGNSRLATESHVPACFGLEVAVAEVLVLRNGEDAGVLVREH